METDENKLVRLIKKRLDIGRTKYGPWEINDDRNYERETLEELLDAALYLAAAILKRRKND
jgi:hypothetical protein